MQKLTIEEKRAEVIKATQKKLGKTNIGMANLLNVDKSTYERMIYNAKGLDSISTLQDISHKLNLLLEELLIVNGVTSGSLSGANIIREIRENGHGYSNQILQRIIKETSVYF
jgi:hypothetical protein